ncbi:TrkA family potassium uptake protein [Anaerocolumna aminovalerica]|jgi:trk system potassium uptake protein TrkA|uniref:Trk system potassium uptake protein TrkA n=1 Tax=Anaerocolumna aminovalerica TaxID=1527 RepID=A0A1I5DHF7_9FIRM|nr:TrkA family potassium uptake protein [Anaerocolumna aminovalerica]MBU5333898.1 TrkA family potassium uptake protein [Anaerocolumna aminovalerica]MDU6263175.1 TrkA family potassium uptake protein [Anaerocolumna aminovalerica]SFN98567.1 trk system potassium uptake protein TrkA [Anaerocolumna aminovalerica]
MLQHKAIIEFGIIGLGRFGFALAKTLADAGKEVLVIDNNESKIKQIRNITENAFVVGPLDKESLEDAGIQNCGTVIVCIGEKVDVSILTTLNVISMGVPRVIAKAFSYEQGLILEKIGAEVIYPENDMAIRLANRLISSSTVDSIELKGDINISEVKLTNKIAGQTVLEANLRQKYKLNIIAIEREGDTITEITPDYVLREDDKVVVVGKKDELKKFELFLRGLR